MSSGPVTRSEFEKLVAEVAELRITVRDLSERLSVPSPPESSSNFELVGETVVDVASASAASTLSPERVGIAESIGKWIKLRLVGPPCGLSGRERVPLPSRIYLVFRSVDLVLHDPPLTFSTWRDCKEVVLSGGQPGDSVFIGLPSRAEARLVCLAAGKAEPAALRQA